MCCLRKLLRRPYVIDTSSRVAVTGFFTVNVSLGPKVGRAIRSDDCWTRAKLEEVDAELEIVANGLEGEVFIGELTIT